MKSVHEIMVESRQGWQRARIGTGNVVHVLTDFGALCGSGKNSKGTRRPSRSAQITTEDGVNCKKCLELEAKHREKYT